MGFILFRVLQNSMTFHDLVSFSKLAVIFKNLKNFPCFRVFLDLKQFNGYELWCPPKYVPFALFNYSSLSYIVLALSSSVTDLSNTDLIFHDFQGPTTKFHDFPGVEDEMLRFHELPGFTLTCTNPDKCDKPIRNSSKGGPG